jgi:endonuclease YncB( thermonuclease family)
MRNCINNGQKIIMIKLTLLVAILFIGFVSVYGALASPFDRFDLIANVTKVIDGDTIQLDNGDRIRLAIANTPERGENGYKEATSFTAKTCLGKLALIDYDSKQKQTYGRDVAAVICVDMHFINKELIDDGYAVQHETYCKPNKSEFRDILCK